MPNDKTVGDIVTVQIAESYQTGKMPKALTAGQEPQ
jgi:hypothetical protein